jgi:hypothetical protein
MSLYNVLYCQYSFVSFVILFSFLFFKLMGLRYIFLVYIMLYSFCFGKVTVFQAFLFGRRKVIWREKFIIFFV